MSVPVFCSFCIPEKLVWKYSQNWTKLGQDLLFFQHVHGVQRRDGGEPRGSHTMGPRGPPCRAVGWCGPHGRLQPPPFRLFIHLHGKTLDPKPLSTKSSRDAVVVNPSLGGFRSSSRHPAGEGNHHRRALHHHACLRSDA